MPCMMGIENYVGRLSRMTYALLYVNSKGWMIKWANTDKLLHLHEAKTLLDALSEIDSLGYKLITSTSKGEYIIGK